LFFFYYEILQKYFYFKFQLTDTEKDVNQSSGILLPLSTLFDATVDDDYLAVQSLLSKNYDVNTKVKRRRKKNYFYFNLIIKGY